MGERIVIPSQLSKGEMWGWKGGDTPKVFQGSERNTFVKQIYFFQRRTGLKERAFVEFPHELETSAEWKSFEIGLFAQKSSGSQT